jgi:putative PIN family toxin of toxin-antitoxin system
MKTYYAVIDTNVLVSALLKPSSIPGQVLKHVFVGRIIPLIDGRIIDEYRDVLMRPKFQFEVDSIERLITEYEKCAINVKAAPSTEVFIDRDDVIFYEVAMEKQSESAYLVTGNLKHYPLKPFIVTAREMLEIISEIEE